MKKLLTTTTLAISLIALTACAPPMTRQQQLDTWYQRCLDYGFHPNTNGIAECVQKQEVERDRAVREPQRPMFCQGAGFGNGSGGFTSMCF